MTASVRSTVLALALFTSAIAVAQEMPQDVSASGNEPFWRVEITSGDFTLTRPDFPPLVLSVVDRQTRTDGTHVIVSATSSPALRAVLRLIPGPCADTMADQTYPFTALVELGNTELLGCGGDPRDLLTAAEVWTVTEIGGAAVLDETEVTLTFAQGGAVSGSGGCNRYTSLYTITGEGVSFGPVAATRIACPEPIMAQEMAVFAGLEEVFSFDIDADGSLILNGPEGAIIRATAP